MFIALVRFPDVPADRDADFQDWFAWSNQQLAGAEGLRSRRLLRQTSGHYAALVEHESPASFAAMHAEPVVADIQARLHQIVPEPPHATQFHVLTEPATDAEAGGCCGDGDAGRRHQPRSSTGGEALAGEHTCCHAG